MYADLHICTDSKHIFMHTHDLYNEPCSMKDK